MILDPSSSTEAQAIDERTRRQLSQEEQEEILWGNPYTYASLPYSCRTPEVETHGTDEVETYEGPPDEEVAWENYLPDEQTVHHMQDMESYEVCNCVDAGYCNCRTPPEELLEQTQEEAREEVIEAHPDFPFSAEPQLRPNLGPHAREQGPGYPGISDAR